MTALIMERSDGNKQLFRSRTYDSKPLRKRRRGYSGIHSDEPGDVGAVPPVATPVRRALMRTYGAM